MDDKKVEFFPFHAINDFMRPDYRIEVVRTTLHALPNLPVGLRGPIDRLTKRVVQVPGFRDSRKAPAALKTRPMAEALKKSPELVAAILSAWTEVHPGLRQQVYDLLKARDWEVLPAEADRTKLPGFLTHWPKNEEFEVLNKAFKDMYPDAQAKDDDVSLMIVWISGRLPYKLVGEEDEVEAEAAG